MTAPIRAVLGVPDPLHVDDDTASCPGRSQVQAGMVGPFLCTRPSGHGDDVEHVASGCPTGDPDDAIAVAAWLEGGPLRILGLDAPIPDRMKARYRR